MATKPQCKYPERAGHDTLLCVEDRGHKGNHKFKEFTLLVLEVTQFGQKIPMDSKSLLKMVRDTTSESSERSGFVEIPAEMFEAMTDYIRKNGVAGF